jgi:MIP family channel proteins
LAKHVDDTRVIRDNIINTPSLLQRAIAECLGTFVLVSAGCGAIVVNSITGALTHVGVALSFGLAVGLMVAALGPISGAQLNPAVTFGLALSGHLRWRDAPVYMIAQLIGAVAGAVTLWLLFGNVAHLGSTTPSGSAFQSVGVELLLTAILMFVIMVVGTDKQVSSRQAALFIGGAVALDALWGGPISGASMNPARSFGPALISGLWTSHWVYWVGPVLGASVGALLYRWLYKPTAHK